MSEKDTKKATEETTTTDAEETVVEAANEEVEEQVDAEQGDKAFEFVEDPEFDIEYKGECAYEVKVTIPAANRAKKSGEVFEDLRKEAEVPGFRKGRAPLRLLEKRFGKAVRGEAESTIIDAAWRKLIDKEDLKPIALPDIPDLDEKHEGSADEPLKVTFKFEVSPRVELGKYRGLELERPIVTVKDSDVDNAIEEMRDRAKTYATLEGGVAAEGDQVVIDFVGEIDGVPFEGGTAEAYPYILGSKRFFAEFEEALAGASPGDELKTTITFPEDYFQEDLRKKDADFTITVKEVKRSVKPEINDDFAKTNNFESVDDMREKVLENLRKSSETQSRSIVEARAMEAVIADSKFEIPKTLIESVGKDYLEREQERLRQNHVSVSDMEARAEEMAKESQESALKTITAMTTMNEIGEAEGVEVKDEDFEKEIAEITERTGMDAAMVSSYIMQGEQRSTYEDRIYRTKVYNVLLDNAKLTDKEVDRNELEDEADKDEE